MLPRIRLWFPTFLRIVGLVVSAVGLTIAMRGLFFPWISGYDSVITGLDFLVHGERGVDIIYGLAWIVFLTYYFIPNYVSYCAIVFSIYLPCCNFFVSWLIDVGYRGNPYDIFEPSTSSPVDFKFREEPGFGLSFMGMSLILLGVFIGMNNRNKIIYAGTMITICLLLGLLIGLTLLVNWLRYR